MLESIQNSVEISEGAWRISIFIFMLVALAIWELISPRRLKQKSTLNQFNSRRLNNIIIVIVDTLLVRLLLPLLPVGMAIYTAENSMGLFNLINLPTWIVFILSLLILDCIIYWQHRLFHTIPMFWRLHRMHHTDIEFDFTTAVRFHPIEIILSILLKLIVIFLLGAPAIAVMVFEILLSSSALFNHSNIKLSKSVDKVLRLFIVTPDMHRVHHSVYREETDSNYGFNIPWWDKLFGTYVDQPKDGHIDMSIGIEIFREEKDSRIDQLLLQPFRSK